MQAINDLKLQNMSPLKSISKFVPLLFWAIAYTLIWQTKINQDFNLIVVIIFALNFFMINGRMFLCAHSGGNCPIL